MQTAHLAAKQAKHYPASGNLSPCIVLPVHPLTLLFTHRVQSNLLSGQKYAQFGPILVGVLNGQSFLHKKRILRVHVSHDSLETKQDLEFPIYMLYA